MNLTLSSSPHIRSKDRTGRIMLDVVIALLPTLIAGVCVFGFRSALVTLVSMAAAVTAEGIIGLIRKKQTLFDFSAAVSGMLVALTIPATSPYWLAALGGIFAVVIVKVLCGGLGQNIFNPALVSRAFLMLLFPAWLTRCPVPGSSLPLGSTVDAVTSATPLHSMQMPSRPGASLMDMFLGNIGGAIGEVSALALLLGGIYLIIRKVISVRIPAAYLGTVALLTLIFAKGDAPFAWMMYSLLGGGVMLGAIFMATDYASSPITPLGQIIYGIGCGVLTVLFRYFGLFPEGVTYAILLMNGCVWALDRYAVPRRFGTGKGGAA